MSTRNHLCVRCGIAIHNAGRGCNDCNETDPVLLERWRVPRNAPRPVVHLTHTRILPGAEITHGTDRGYRLHRLRGEDSCDPCRVAKAESSRKYRARNTTTTTGAKAA